MTSSNNINKLELQDLQLAESLKKITLHKLIAEKVNIAQMLEKTNRTERIEVCGSMLKFLKERNVVSEEIRRRRASEFSACGQGTWYQPVERQRACESAGG